MKSVLFIFVLGFLGNPLLAQKGYELGAWVGAAQYFGDLNNLYRIDEPGLSFGFTGRYNFDTRLSVRMQLNYHRIAGADANSRNAFDLRRNLSFFSDIFEIAPCMEFNFLPLKHGSREDFVSPYMYAGFSIFHYNPKTEYNGESVALRELGTEGQIPGQEYNEISTAWLIGGGVKLDLTDKWSLNFDLGYRLAATDHLDDVSGYYPDYTELLINRGQIAVDLSDRSIPVDGTSKIGTPGTQRGDHNENDKFLSFGINLIYYFGKLRCPPISYPDL
ncbi:MAG: outer membrane beta-barrel protein [Saprospiraceae bacterium]|nr:outer membrane beta-barrel protein [Saprospiraceae bacterium]